jgi:adenosylcobinamide-GDP ribazoletransferase
MRLGYSLLADLCVCLEFFTLLPCWLAARRSDPVTLVGFSRAVRMLPVAGALLGALAAAVMAGAAAVGLSPLIAAPLAISALIIFSGAMHEDGLADCADGFFGGETPVRKLEIMQDGRIGTFGAVALILSLYLRAASLALAADKSLGLACAILIGTAALSRGLALVPLVLLPPARQSGAGFAAGKPAKGAFAVAICLAIPIALAPVLMGANLPRALLGVGLALGSAYAVAVLARHEIGGQTGDVAGAAQQLAEIVYFLTLAPRA